LLLLQPMSLSLKFTEDEPTVEANETVLQVLEKPVDTINVDAEGVETPVVDSVCRDGQV
jgi:hypothetical protein